MCSRALPAADTSPNNTRPQIGTQGRGQDTSQRRRAAVEEAEAGVGAAVEVRRTGRCARTGVARSRCSFETSPHRTRTTCSPRSNTTDARTSTGPYTPAGRRSPVPQGNPHQIDTSGHMPCGCTTRRPRGCSCTRCTRRPQGNFGPMRSGRRSGARSRRRRRWFRRAWRRRAPRPRWRSTRRPTRAAGRRAAGGASDVTSEVFR